MFEGDKPIVPTLHWEKGQGESRSVVLRGVETVIGRKEECDLVIPHESISRLHAKILSSAGEFLLVDLASIHGTFVNGQRIQACLLDNDDRIQFGKCDDIIHFQIKRRSQGLGPDLNDPSNTTNLTLTGHLPPNKVSDVLHAELRKSIEQRHGVEAELRLAQEIQKGLLPEQLPKIDGFGVCAYSAPTRYVGGDFYDVIEMPDGIFFGLLGDVSGKGVAASLLSSMVLGCLGVQLRSNGDPEVAVNALNSLLYQKASGRFVTLFLFQFDSNGHGQFISAGHNPAYVYRNNTGEVIEVSSNSLITGVFPSCSFRSEVVELQSGDVMLVYSDGLTEAEDTEGAQLGEDVVRKTLRQAAPAGAESVKASLLDLVDRFTAGHKQNDDVTFLVVEKL